MDLHEYMCPEVFPQTARLREHPERLAAYADSLITLCDFERGRAVFATGPQPDAQPDTQPDGQPDGQRLALADVPISASDLDPTTFQAQDRGFRTFDLATHLRKLGARWFLGNMRDAVPFAPEIYFNHPANIFQYNRRLTDRSGVLWRLPNYYEPTRVLGYALDERRETDTVPFTQKIRRVVWRGNRTGRQWMSPYGYRQLSAQFDLEQLALHSSWHPRAKAVLLSFEDPERFNCRFSISPKMWKRRTKGEARSELERRHRDHSWLLRFRYQLCLPGNDVATQLYWIISSNSLALKVESDYAVLPDYFLQPWVHYVPIAPDLSDLPAKFDYLESNPDLCEAIIERAKIAYDRIIDAHHWEEAEMKVLDRLGLLTP